MSIVLHRACCLAVLFLTAELYLIAALEPGRRGTATVLLYAGLTLLSLALWRLQSRHRVAGTQWVLWTALLSRLLAFGVPGYLSHDMDRYLWDGAVALSGFDPYSVAAADPALAALRAQWPTPSEHLQYPTLYPPLALGLFAACAAAGPVAAPWVWKGIVLLASLGIVFGARAVAARLDRGEIFPLVALSPLLIVEGQVGAHLDLLVAAAVTAGIWALYSGHERTSALGWGLGAALKLLPTGAIAVWLTGRGLGRSLVLLVIASGVFLVPYGVALALGARPVGSIAVFFEKWRFGSPLWFGFESTLGPAMPWVAIVGALLCGLYALWLARRSPDASLLLFAMAIPLLFSPVVFPWYLAPLVPLLLVTRSLFLFGWLTVLPMTYEILDRFDVDGSWEPAAWPVVALVLSWGTGLAFDLRSGAKGGVEIPLSPGSTP